MKNQTDEKNKEKIKLTGWDIFMIVLGVIAVTGILFMLITSVSNARPYESDTDDAPEIEVMPPMKTPSKDEVTEHLERVTGEPITDVIETTPETEPSVGPMVPDREYFDVPLSIGLQNYIFELCERHNVDPAMVIAIIQMESKCKDDAIGDNGNSLGLMQIQPRWHSGRMARLGCMDLLDPYQNVTVGIDILSCLMSMGNSLDWVLMSYNGGSGHANNHIANGTISYYAATVKDYMNYYEGN